MAKLLFIQILGLYILGLVSIFILFDSGERIFKIVVMILVTSDLFSVLQVDSYVLSFSGFHPFGRYQLVGFFQNGDDDDEEHEDVLFDVVDSGEEGLAYKIADEFSDEGVSDVGVFEYLAVLADLDEGVGGLKREVL